MSAKHIIETPESRLEVELVDIYTMKLNIQTPQGEADIVLELESLHILISTLEEMRTYISNTHKWDAMSRFSSSQSKAFREAAGE